eukprot:1503386-Rhodomonas_salina.1
MRFGRLLEHDAVVHDAVEHLHPSPPRALRQRLTRAEGGGLNERGGRRERREERGEGREERGERREERRGERGEEKGEERGERRGGRGGEGHLSVAGGAELAAGGLVVGPDDRTHHLELHR